MQYMTNLVEYDLKPTSIDVWLAASAAETVPSHFLSIAPAMEPQARMKING